MRALQSFGLLHCIAVLKKLPTKLQKEFIRDDNSDNWIIQEVIDYKL